MKHFLFMCVLLLAGFWAQAQRTDLLTGPSFGLKGGRAMLPHGISGIWPTFIDSGYVYVEKNTTVTEKRPPGSSFGAAFAFRSDNLPWLAMEANIMFTTIQGGIHVEQGNGLIYDLDFRMLYNTLGLAVKINPWAVRNSRILQGFYGSLGSQVGVNLSPDFLTYDHNNDFLAQGPAKVQQLELRRLIKDKPDWGVQFGAGWEQGIGNSWGVNLEWSYYHGFADIIDVAENMIGVYTPKETQIIYWRAALGVIFKLDR